MSVRRLDGRSNVMAPRSGRIWLNLIRLNLLAVSGSAQCIRPGAEGIPALPPLFQVADVRSCHCGWVRGSLRHRPKPAQISTIAPWEAYLSI